MRQLTWKDIGNIEPNTLITCRGSYGRNLTSGKQYACLTGVEWGIFSNSPYVMVIDDIGERSVLHASRFTISN